MPHSQDPGNEEAHNTTQTITLTRQTEPLSFRTTKNLSTTIDPQKSFGCHLWSQNLRPKEESFPTIKLFYVNIAKSWTWSQSVRVQQEKYWTKERGNCWDEDRFILFEKQRKSQFEFKGWRWKFENYVILNDDDPITKIVTLILCFLLGYHVKRINLLKSNLAN